MGSQIQASTFRASDYYIQQKYAMDRTGNTDCAAKMFAMMQECSSNGAAMVLDSGDYLINPYNWHGCYVTSGGAWISNLSIVGNGKVNIIFDETTSGQAGSDAPVNDISGDSAGYNKVGLRQSFIGIGANSSFRARGIKWTGWNKTIITQPTTSSTAVSGAGYDIDIQDCEFEQCTLAFGTEYYHNIRNLDGVTSGKKALYVDKIDRFVFRGNKLTDMWQMGVQCVAYRIGTADVSSNQIIGINRGCAAGVSIPSTMLDTDRNIAIYIQSGGRLADYIVTPSGIDTDDEVQDSGSYKLVSHNVIRHVVKTSGSAGDTNGIAVMGGTAHVVHNDIEDVMNTSEPDDCEGIYTKLRHSYVQSNRLKNAGQQGCITLKGFKIPETSDEDQTWPGSTNPYSGSTTRHYDVWHESARIEDNVIEADDPHDFLRVGIRVTVSELTTSGVVNPYYSNVSVSRNHISNVFVGILCASGCQDMSICDNVFTDIVPGPFSQYTNIVDYASIPIRNPGGTGVEYGGIGCIFVQTQDNLDVSRNTVVRLGETAEAWTAKTFNPGDMVFKGTVDYSHVYLCTNTVASTVVGDLDNASNFTKLMSQQAVFIRLLNHDDCVNVNVNHNSMRDTRNPISAATIGVGLTGSYAGTTEGFVCTFNRWHRCGYGAMFLSSTAGWEDWIGRYEYNEHYDRYSGTAGGYWITSPNSGKGLLLENNRNFGSAVSVVGSPSVFNSPTTITFV